MASQFTTQIPYTRLETQQLIQLTNLTNPTMHVYQI